MSHPHGTALLERKLIEEERKLAKLLEEICDKHDVSIIESLASNSGKTRRRAASSDMQPVSTLSANESRSLSPIFRRASDFTPSTDEVDESLKKVSSSKELQTLLKQNALDVSEMLKKKDATIDGLKQQINDLENTIIRFIQYKNSVASSAQLLSTTVTKTLSASQSPTSAQQQRCVISLKDKEFVLKMNALLAKQVQQTVSVPESVTKRLNQIQRDYSSSFGANKTAFIDAYAVPRSTEPAVYPVQPFQVMNTTTESTLSQLFDQLVLRQNNINSASSHNSSSSTKDNGGKKPVWIDKRVFVMFCLVAGVCEESKLNLSMILRFYDENTTPVLLKSTAEYEQLMNYHGFVNAMNSVGAIRASKGKVAPTVSTPGTSSIAAVSEVKPLTSAMSTLSITSTTVTPSSVSTPGALARTPLSSSLSGSSGSTATVSSSPTRPPPPGPPPPPAAAAVSSAAGGSGTAARPPPPHPPQGTTPNKAPPPVPPSAASTPAPSAAPTNANKSAVNLITMTVSSGLTALVDTTLGFILSDMIENSAAIDIFIDLFLPVVREEVIGVFAKHQPVFHAAYGRSKSYGLMDGKKISAGATKKKTVGSTLTKNKVLAASQQDTTNYSNFEVFCCNFDIVPHLCGISVARRISQYVSYATVTEDFSYLVACIYYLAVYLTDSADWGIPITTTSAAGKNQAKRHLAAPGGSVSGSTSAAGSVVDEDEEQAKLTSAQRQQVHFQAVLENIEKIIWSIEASSH